MGHIVETQWMGNMQFNALVQGHTIVMDAPERVGGEDLGPIPKPFILTALSGCTAMDVVALLRKQAIYLQDFSLTVHGEISKKAPIVYTEIHVIYEMKGSDKDMDVSLQAVQDSQEKYCGVSAMLKQIMPVTWEVIYNGRQVFNNLKIPETVNSSN